MLGVLHPPLVAHVGKLPRRQVVPLADGFAAEPLGLVGLTDGVGHALQHHALDDVLDGGLESITVSDNYEVGHNGMGVLCRKYDLQRLPS